MKNPYLNHKRAIPLKKTMDLHRHFCKKMLRIISNEGDARANPDQKPGPLQEDEP